MKKYISSIIRKDLSRAKHQGGIMLKEYFENIFKTLYNAKFMISMNEFESIVKKDACIDSDCTSFNNELILSLKPEYFKSKEYSENEEELYNYAYIKNLFKEENNTNILLIYKIIMDSEDITYLEIANIVNKVNPNIKIDKKQASHYCKLLKKINLVYKTNKQNKQNERIVRKNETYSVYKDNVEIVSDDDDNSDNESEERERDITACKEENQIDSFGFNVIESYGRASDPKRIFEITKREGAYVSNTLKFNKHYIENRFSFIVDENNIENNLFFHLLINSQKGLTVNQICSLLGFVGREKAIVRFLNNLEKKHCIKHSSVRKGKKYEFVYKIDERNNQVPGYIYKYVEYYTDNNKGSGNSENINEKIKIEECISNNTNNLNNRNTTNNNITPIKSNLPQTPKDKEIIPPFTQDTSLPVPPVLYSNEHLDLNSSDFAFIIDKISSESEETYTHLKSKYKITSPDINDLTVTSNVKFNIILDFFFANLKVLKLRTFDNVNFNRYLFCLNKINERKILSMNDLKQFIIKDLEQEIGFKIDRKTLRNALLNLETLGFIKTIEFELTMKNKVYVYQNNREELIQKKLVVMRRDVNPTEDMIKDIEELIRPRIKMNNTTDLELLEYEIEDMQMVKRENVISKSESKNIISQSNILNPEDKSVKEIKQEINNLFNSVDVSISLHEKILPNFVTTLDKIKSNHYKDNFSFFMTRWKRFYFIRQNLKFLFEEMSQKRKKQEEEYEEDKQTVLMYKLIETNSSPKVVIPQYLLNNILGVDNSFCKEYDYVPQEKLNLQNSYSKVRPDMANLITQKEEESVKETKAYDYQFLRNLDLSKEIKNSYEQKLNESEIKFANKYFTPKINNQSLSLKKYLMNKRKRMEEDTEAEYKEEIKVLPNRLITNFNEKLYKRQIDFYSVVNKIYFNPKITMKKLRHSFFNILPSEVIYTDFILYLHKLGLLKISSNSKNKILYSKNKIISVEDDMTLELEESAKFFLGI